MQPSEPPPTPPSSPPEQASISRSVGHGLRGIGAAWSAEVGLRRQVLGGVAALALLGLLRPPALWWALLVLPSIAVVSLELLNSALEATCDALHPEPHPGIGRAKDMAAGAVIVGNISQAWVGVTLILSAFDLVEL